MSEPCGVIDWDLKPEPWRSVGRESVAVYRRVAAGMPTQREVVAAQQPGHLLADYRRGRGWSQKMLADLVGCTVQQISEIERGIVRNPRWQLRHHIATELGVAVTDIWRE
jgi:DNA-binding XRE family transcriptional regulator